MIAEAIKCLHCIYLARSEVPAKKQGRKFNFCKRLSNTGILSFLSLCFTRRRNLTVFFCLFLLQYVFESYCLHQTSKILFATSRPVTGYTPAKNRRRKSRMKKVKNQLDSQLLLSPKHFSPREMCNALFFLSTKHCGYLLASIVDSALMTYNAANDPPTSFPMRAKQKQNN